MISQNTYFLFVHGNPGHDGDFNDLISALGIPYHNAIVLSLLHEQDPVTCAKEITLSRIPASSQLVAVGYSWGAWLVCKLLEDENFVHKAHINAAFLVSPYVNPQNKMSVIAKMLMSIPGIKTMLAKKVAQNKFNNYAHEILSDDKQSRDMLDTNRTFLLNPATWLSAIHLKRLQEENPVAKNISVPVTIIVAKDDKVVDVKMQIEFLKSKITHGSIEFLPDGNHGLIWTHTKHIAEKLKQSLITLLA